MPNDLQKNGASPGKQTKRTSLWNARFWDGVVSVKGALRDCSTNLENRFYGARGDSLLGEDYQSVNVEITPKLTLARRYGNSVWNSNLWTNLNSFYDFRLFNSDEEEIKTIVDTKTTLYEATNNSQVPIWQKNSASGQSYMQSVGNTLFWGDGFDRKKWLNTLQVRIPYFPQTFPNTQNPYNFTPYELNSFIIDTNGDVEQLIGTVVQLSSFYLLNDVAVFTPEFSSNSGEIFLPKSYEFLYPGLQLYFPPGSEVAEDLNQGSGITLTIQNLSGSITSVSTYTGGIGGYIVGDVINLNQTSPGGSQGGQIEVLSVGTSSGSGYTNAIGVPTSTNGVGIGASLNITTSSGGLVSAVVSSGGTAYNINDLIYPVQLGGSGGYFKVTAVFGSSILGVSLATGIPKNLSIISSGTGYVTAENVPTTGGSGVGLTVNIADDETTFSSSVTYVGSPITSFSVSNPGTGYLVDNQLSLVEPAGETGSGALFSVTGVYGSASSLSFVSGGPSITPYTTGVPTYTTSGSGTGAAFNITSVSSGVITGITVTSPGSGFAVNDLIYITQGLATGAVLTVLTLSGSGISTVAISSGGLVAYTPAVGLATTTSGSGTGATITITGVTNGSINSGGWVLASGGTGYKLGDLIYPTEGGASGAVFTVNNLSGGGGIGIWSTGPFDSTYPYGPPPSGPSFLPTTGGTGTGATVQLIPIYTGDVITGSAVSNWTPGSGYTVGDKIYPTWSGSDGTLFYTVLGITSSPGPIASLALIDPGIGYTTQSSLATTVNAGGPSGATINIVAGDFSYIPPTTLSEYVDVFSGGYPVSSSLSNAAVSWAGIGETTVDGSALWINRGPAVEGASFSNLQGNIKNLNLVSTGSNYSDGVVETTSESGSGATIVIQSTISGAILSWSLGDGGYGYSVGDKIYPSGNDSAYFEVTSVGSQVAGGPVYNWGISGGTEAPAILVNNPSGEWEPNTYYSSWNFIVVTVGGLKYLQQVLSGGKSGSSAPSPWNTVVGQNTTDGTVTWVCISNDGDTGMSWTAETQYSVGHVLEETVSSLPCVFQLQPYSGITTEGPISAYCWNTGTQSTSVDFGEPAQLPGNVPMSQNGTQTTSTASYQGSMNCLFLTTGPNGTLTNLSTPTIAGDGTVSSAVNQLFPTGKYCSVAMFPVFNIPAPGIYTFTLGHELHTFWGIGSGSLNIDVVSVRIKGSVLSITSNSDLTSKLGVGTSLTFSGLNSASFLNGQTVSVLSVSGRVFTASFSFSDYGPFPDSGIAATGNTLVPSVVSGPMNWTAKYNYSTGTPVKGYPIMSANLTEGGFVVQDIVQINFPSAGVYPAEIQHGMWYHSTSGYTTPTVSPALPSNTFCFYLLYAPPGSSINYNIIPQSLACSSAVSPTFPAWPTTVSGLQTIAPNYPSVTETSGNYTWFNLGPVSQFNWTASTNYNTEFFIIDTNSNQEVPYEPGISGTTYPSFLTTLYGLASDTGISGSTGLTWMNNGPEGSTPSGLISTSQGGWSYVVSLVNTLDDTVSNSSPASVSTGNFFEANGVFVSGGLPAYIDPQADYVAIFRTDDGGATYYLVPGPASGNGNTEYTLPLAQYLAEGFTDTTPDSGLNTLLEAPVDKQNSLPPKGIINLAFHLSRIFGSVGNTVYWSTGPDTPIGNGYNGFSPNNFAEFPSLVTRIVPLNAGTLVFTVSDIYILSGNGESGSPIVPEPYLQRIGLLSYNALTVNGSIIYFMTTDNQVVELNVHTGVSQVGQPIADLLGRFSPEKSYLTWHSSGYQDQALFTADGSTGWYKMLTAIPPEVGTPWCPKANIVGGAGAIQSCETTPGNLQLLIGPPPNTTGPILFRDYTNYQDNGANYPAYFTFGSIVLAHPGQIASIEFFTVDSHKFVGARPLTLGILLGEISGNFEPICHFVNDPPQLPPSNSLWNQRFYLMQSNEPIECRHFQLKVLWEPQNFPDEVESVSPFGGFLQES